MEDPRSLVVAAILLVIATGVAGFGRVQEPGSRKPNWYIIGFGVIAGLIALAAQFNTTP